MSDPVHDLKKFRRLFIALIISSSINALLIASTFFLLFKERPPTPYCLGKPALPEERQAPLALDKSTNEVLRYFYSLSFERLMRLLSSKSLVENGFAERDFALGMLVTYHHFDLERALSGLPKQVRLLQFEKREGVKAEVAVYPGLSEPSFKQIARFAKQEKWPMTPRGLFEHLKTPLKTLHGNDKSLQEAFYLTPHFLAAERLLRTSSKPLENSEIEELLLSGDWETLADFTLQQKEVLDLSDAKRQKFLVDFLEKSSKYAAKLLLKTDPEFALKKLDDRTVMLLLALLEGNEAEVEEFSLALLSSPRCDLVLKTAKNLLLAMKGENFFIDSLKQLDVFSKPDSPLASKEKLYVVQEGDSLWKISRRFKVNIDHLKQVNHLNSDLLRPGSALKIP